MSKYRKNKMSGKKAKKRRSHKGLGSLKIVSAKTKIKEHFSNKNKKRYIHQSKNKAN